MHVFVSCAWRRQQRRPSTMVMQVLLLMVWWGWWARGGGGGGTIKMQTIAVHEEDRRKEIDAKEERRCYPSQPSHQRQVVKKQVNRHLRRAVLVGVELTFRIPRVLTIKSPLKTCSCLVK